FCKADISRYSYDLADVAHLQGQIDGGGLIDGYGDVVVNRRGEASLLGSNAVHARIERDKSVVAGRIGLGVPGYAGAGVEQRDGGSGNDGSGLVGNGAVDAASAGLSEGNRCRQGNEEETQDEMAEGC